MSKVWLISGCSRGLGRAIAEAALLAGDQVLATARRPAHLQELVERFGARVVPATLDVTDPKAARLAVRAARESFGRLDVLVNNAGFGHIAPFEQMSDEQFRDQMETNFFGVVNLTRAAIPLMRSQRSGHVIQISGLAGRIATPGFSAFHAAKWAVSGFSETLRQELAPIGIRVSSVEPGPMRTEWSIQASWEAPRILADYEPSIRTPLDDVRGMVGNEPGDPERIAQLIVRLAYHDDPPAHLVLGRESLRVLEETDHARTTEAELWREISCSADFADARIPELPLTGDHP